MAFICVRLDSSAVGIEPAAHIRQVQRAGRLVGMLVVAPEALVALETSGVAVGDMAFPWACPCPCPLEQNSSLAGKRVHTLVSMARRSWKAASAWYCLVLRAWQEVGLENLARSTQAVQVEGTVVVHCNRKMDKHWDKGLLNTAEDIVELQAVEGTGGSEELGLLGQPEKPRLPGKPVASERTGRTVVEPHIGKDQVGTEKGTGLDPWLEPWGQPEDCNRLRYIPVHRHRDMLQDKFGSLKMMQKKKKINI